MINVIRIIIEDHSIINHLDNLIIRINQPLKVIHFLKMTFSHLKKVTLFVIRMIYLEILQIMIHLNQISLLNQIFLANPIHLMMILMINIINFQAAAVQVVKHRMKIIQIDEKFIHQLVS